MKYDVIIISLFKKMDVVKLYTEQMMSICDISKATKISPSTIRSRLFKAGVLRTRKEGICIAASEGKLGAGRGKKRTFSEEWKKNISVARQAYAEKTAVGTSIKPNGYVEFTRGENKGRLVHIVEMEKKIQRRLFANEVVHHIDHNRSNNHISNLVLMTRAEHAALHAKENAPLRNRDQHGKFK